MNFLRNILIIVVPFYWMISSIRNLLYDLGWMHSKSYDHPIICVGNLSVGGTGKTPMIEYLIRLLQKTSKVATLSRGYKRQSSGFVLADKNTTAGVIGDEAYQIHSKFEDVIIAVDGNRRRGIQNLLGLKTKPDVILLDDAFQHRKVKAGLNILLTTYDRLYANDIVLPTGDLREPRIGAKRADIIIVTKCPEGISKVDKKRVQDRLKLKAKQRLFFSSIEYSKELIAQDGSKVSLEDIRDQNIHLVTGIAKPKPMIDHLKQKGLKFEHLRFPDHHQFTQREINSLDSKECLLTTEKDFTRLKDQIKSASLYYLPIETRISNSEEFNSLIQEFMKTR